MCPKKGLVTSSRGLPKRYPGVDDDYLSGMLAVIGWANMHFATLQVEAFLPAAG